MISWQRRDGTTINLDGDRLRALRMSAEMTQREAADAIGCTAAAVSSWETETAVPSLPQIERIRSVFGDSLKESGAIVVVTWVERELQHLDARYQERMEDPDAE